MHVQRFIMGSALLIMLTGCQHSLVRESMPTVTRTGDVKDVVIRENVSPATLTANLEMKFALSTSAKAM